MSDSNAQQGNDHSSQDEAVVGGYGDQGEAEALLGEPVPEEGEAPDDGRPEGSEPEDPHSH